MEKYNANIWNNHSFNEIFEFNKTLFQNRLWKTQFRKESKRHRTVEDVIVVNCMTGKIWVKWE